MIAAQLLFRAWALYGSWFRFDDANFMSVVLDDRVDLSTLAHGYAGHLTPGAFGVSWLNVKIAGLSWSLPASELLVLQAIGDLGALVFLASAFGLRPGILAPLALFLSTALALPAMISWGPGITQAPLIAVIFWGGWCHLHYLRTRRLRWAVVTMTITAAGLLFGEKTLLVFWLYAFLALAYFASGDSIARLRHVFRSYRSGVVLYGIVAVAYLVWYVEAALNYDPGSSTRQPLLPLIGNLVGISWATGVVGGPFRWVFQPGQSAGTASPGQLFMLAALAVLAIVGLEISRRRLRSKRAWLLVALFLASDVLLISSARSLMGPALALFSRYVTEMAAVSAIALALACLPLRGAVETVEVIPGDGFLERPARITAAIAVVAALGTFSSTTYARDWHDHDLTKLWFDHVRGDIVAHPSQRTLIDTAVPSWMIWGAAYPDNMVRSVLHQWSKHIAFDRITQDEVDIVAGDGHIRPALITPVRHDVGGADRGCSFPERGGRIIVPLDGPVLGYGWWVKVSYYSATATPLTVQAGSLHHETVVDPGLHSLYFPASGERFSTLDFTSIANASGFCITDVQLGKPEAAPDTNGKS
ncbi:hypothetical protein [Nocardioides sp. Kera G14]|uniref:hypothetical protein n=1 Tax=Nocardioides sp. Kera G14 TaxID=2884264 RepID=UPI001D12176D|nr:hypothetical protein [Nocardioides sp. Kera G14]UDY22422.1 hypothetical protein LH076_10050 [Nocardioides sp. Kera G14]